MTLDEFLKEWRSASPTITVKTSGSTGEPKLMTVEKKRMEASARATCSFLGLHPGDRALLCLPLDFIAGKMMAVRAEVTGLILDEQEPSGHPLSFTDGIDYALAAMVPLQVYNTIENETERQRLSKIGNIIIGGGAIDENLERRLQDIEGVRIWSSYGMTETLSHIALRRVNGPDRSQWYTPLPGVEVSLSDEGCIVINAPELNPEILTTNDIGVFNPTGNGFRIIGRRDNVVCSGGLKLHIEELEFRLRSRLGAGFMLTKRRNEALGEELVMLIAEGCPNPEMAKKICAEILPGECRPKAFIQVDKLPVTANGKPARATARAIAEETLGRC